MSRKKIVKIEAALEIESVDENDNYYRDRALLRMLVRSRDNFQGQRIAIDNRLGLKANGEYQNINRAPLVDKEMLRSVSKAALLQEKEITKNLETVLKRFPIYNQWLSKVDGVGPNTAAWIISEFDIRKASMVSNLTSFAGLNPGMVRGRKSVPKSKYKPEMGELLRELPKTKDGEERYSILTDTLIKGDGKTPGFLCPFNSKLRVVLMGILATSFMQKQNSYAVNFYYPYKNRLENSETIVTHRKKGGGVVELPWKDVSPGHRNWAAKRYMIKQFLKDLYVQWRTIEGLSVREPYEEEYLGRKHHIKIRKKIIKTEKPM